MNGRLLSKWLEVRGLSAAQFARMIGVTPATIGRYLNGKRKRLDQPFETAIQVAMKNYDDNLRAVLNSGSALSEREVKAAAG